MHLSLYITVLLNLKQWNGRFRTIIYIIYNIEIEPLIFSIPWETKICTNRIRSNWVKNSIVYILKKRFIFWRARSWYGWNRGSRKSTKMFIKLLVFVVIVCNLYRTLVSVSKDPDRLPGPRAAEQTHYLLFKEVDDEGICLKTWLIRFIILAVYHLYHISYLQFTLSTLHNIVLSLR